MSNMIAPLFPQAIILPVLAFPSWILCIPPLCWQVRQGNISAGSLILWVMMINFFNSINPLIWPRDNLDEWWDGNIWCDINVRIQVGAIVGTTASTAMIVRRLARVMDTSNMTVSTSRNSKLKEKALEILWCWLYPLALIIVYYIVQPVRYLIYGIVGCLSAYDTSWPSIVLSFMWAPLTTLVAAVYAGKLVNPNSTPKPPRTDLRHRHPVLPPLPLPPRIRPPRQRAQYHKIPLYPPLHHLRNHHHHLRTVHNLAPRRPLPCSRRPLLLVSRPRPPALQHHHQSPFVRPSHSRQMGRGRYWIHPVLRIRHRLRRTQHVQENAAGNRTRQGVPQPARHTRERKCDAKQLHCCAHVDVKHLKQGAEYVLVQDGFRGWHARRHDEEHVGCAGLDAKTEKSHNGDAGSRAAISTFVVVLCSHIQARDTSAACPAALRTSLALSG
jgi:hypothetical protein